MARIALVTGGMGGLGEAVCIRLASLGHRVITTYSPGNATANKWLASMEQQGYNVRAYRCDVASYESARECISTIEKEIGPVDVLVNNAGITRDMSFKKPDEVAGLVAYLAADEAAFVTGANIAINGGQHMS